jgi:5-methyltetrahydrofolate--homocysteine methyltransferase
MKTAVTLTSIDKTEALYYLGYKGSEPDKNTTDGLVLCEKMILEVISPSFVMKILDPNHPVFFGNDIKEHLKNCEKAALFCATLGHSADRIIDKCRLISPELQLLADALCNAAVEQVCDIAEEEIKKKYPGASLTTRYSPGYGDFPIEMQRDVLALLDAKKYIGVSTSESFMMSPLKSVSAVVGINFH